MNNTMQTIAIVSTFVLALFTIGCGQTPEQEAARFISTFADCLEENRDTITDITDQPDPEACGLSEDDLSTEEARTFVTGAVGRAFAAAMQQGMAAALGAAFTGTSTPTDVANQSLGVMITELHKEAHNLNAGNTDGLVEAAEAVESAGDVLPDTRDTTPHPEPSPSEKRPWNVTVTTDPVEGTQRIVARNDSTQRTADHIGRPFTPSLIVRCQNNNTDVYINWNNFLDGNSGGYDDDRHIVTIRIGDGEPQRIRATVSTNNEATFIPSPIPTILRPMVGESTLAARTTPYGESPQTAIFDITGAEEALAPIADACNWTWG